MSQCGPLFPFPSSASAPVVGFRSPGFSSGSCGRLIAPQAPAFAIPSVASAPVVGFGSPGFSSGGFQTGGWGRLVAPQAPAFAIPSVASAPVFGFGSGSFGATGVPSASLGTLSGIEPSCINQIPAAEVVIRPPPVAMILPGPILSATGLPVAVGGNTPCAVSYGSSVIGGFRRGLPGRLGGQLGSSLSRRGSLICGRRGSICL